MDNERNYNGNARTPAPTYTPTPENTPHPAPRYEYTAYTPRQMTPQSPSPVYMRTQMPPTQQKRSPGAGIKALIIAFCFVLAVVGGFAGGYVANSLRYATIAPESQLSAISPDVAFPIESGIPAYDGVIPMPDVITSSNLTNSPADRDLTAPEVAAAVRSSVVEIKTETVRQGTWTGTYVSEGAGSGVIISEDGYIVTNNHVISGASSIVVRLVDGREYPASLVATDQRTDIAVIKVSETGLPFAVFGDSGTLVIGESVLAVGNPLGELGGTVTGGMISALDREMIVEGESMTLLQTDAAVNPGNSGGGLFNMRAELIGVVNAKSGGLNIEGLGFAIPANIARDVANDLIAFGFVRGRPDTGLELIDIQSSQTARWYRVNQLGLYIIDSTNDKLMNGDRIIEVNGHPVSNLVDYSAALKGLGIGDTVRITVARGNSSITEEITLTEWRP